MHRPGRFATSASATKVKLKNSNNGFARPRTSMNGKILSTPRVNTATARELGRRLALLGKASEEAAAASRRLGAAFRLARRWFSRWKREFQQEAHEEHEVSEF